MSATEERLQALADRLNFVAHSVSDAIDRYEAVDPQPLARRMARGRYWGALQDGRAQAAAIARHLPSPNALTDEVRDEAAELGRSTFAFIAACEESVAALEAECQPSAN